MDISNWPMDRIMQLPVDCLGTRFTIIFSDAQPAVGDDIYFNNLALTDRCVLHEIHASIGSSTVNVSSPIASLALVLANRQPANLTEFLTHDNLLTGIDEETSDIQQFRTPMHLTRLKLPILAQGRKVALKFSIEGVFAAHFNVALVFSSIPREIPDFYSGHPGDQWDEMIRLMRIGAKIR